MHPVVTDIPSTAKPTYVRFGKLPKGRKSHNWRNDQSEPGVSVYSAWIEEDWLWGECLYLDVRFCDFASALFICDEDRGVYEVSGGKVVGAGSDGEPCLGGRIKVRQIDDCRIYLYA